MLERILVPLDGTPQAEQALPAAVSLARAGGSELHLVTVLVPPLLGLPDLPTEASLGEVEAEYLEGIAARLRDAGVHSVATKLLRVPDIAGGLEAYRATQVAGLTVMSSHGRGPLERAWLGSVADRLIRSSEAPVLLVRAVAAGRGALDLTADVRFRRVLIPLDGSSLSHAALAPASTLAGKQGTTYLLVRIVEPPYAQGAALLPAGFEFPEQHMERARLDAVAELHAVADSLACHGLEVETMARVATPVAEGVLRTAEERGADLIAIATHGRGGLRRLVLGSVADKLIRASRCSVLVVPPGGR